MDRDVYEPRFAHHWTYCQRTEATMRQRHSWTWKQWVSAISWAVCCLAAWMFIALAVLWFLGG